MPDLREVFLEERLRNSRFGTPIRASLIPALHLAIVSLKEDTQRTYRDIFLIVVNVFTHHPHFFAFDRERRTRQDLFFRVSKKDSATLLTWAWERNLRRSNFLGDLMEQFLHIVPISVFRKILVTRADQALRLKEEFKKYERVATRNV